MKDSITEQIINIVESNLTNDDKKNSIEKIDDKSGNYKEIIILANKLVSKTISKKEFYDELKLFNKKMEKQKNDRGAKIVDCAIDELVTEELQNNPEKTPEEARAEITEKIENLATINEITNDKENYASLTENTDESFELAKKTEKAKLKKLYDYKVEGQITSGIKELDEFLKIIQPAINQAIIQPWKLIYGVNDKFQESKEALISWDKDRKDLKNAWKTLQVMGLIDENDKVSFFEGNSKVKNKLAGKLHSYLVDQANKDIYDELIADKTEELTKKITDNNNYEESWTDQEKANYEQQKQNYIDSELTTYKNSDEFKNKLGNARYTKLFDTTKNYEIQKNVINKALLNLIKNHCRDGEKISDDGKKYMEGYTYILDLFNTNNDDSFIDSYYEDIEYILKEAKKGHRFEKGFIEDETEIHDNNEQKQKKGQFAELTKLLENLGKQQK